jgi:tetratricopeptide (TPR) repeat protein
LYSWRGHRIASYEAAYNLERFRDEAKTSRFMLSGPYLHPDEKAEGLEVARAAVGRFGVFDRRDWADAPTFALLEAPDQAALRHEIAELLIYLAAGEAGKAESASPEAKAPHRSEAIRLNELAGLCSPGEEDRYAIDLQRRKLRAEETVAEMKGTALPPPDPKTRRGLYMTAYGMMSLGNYQSATELLRRAIRLDPQDPFVHYALGNCELVLGRSEKALASLDTSIALWPRSYRSYYIRAGAHAERGEHKEALADFDESIRLRPDFLAAYADRARSKAVLNDSAGAIADITRAIEGGDQPTRLYFVRASMRRQAGDLEGAALDHQQGLSLRPNDELSWVARGLARLAQSPADAMGDFDAALAINSGSIPALEAKANALSERLGRVGEAIRVLDRLVESHPDYAPARSGRGVLLARERHREAALRDARDSLRLDHHDEVTYQVAGIYALTSREQPTDKTMALRLLETVFKKGYGLDLVDRDPDLDPIRSLPEFRRLVDAFRVSRSEGASLAP